MGELSDPEYMTSMIDDLASLDYLHDSKAENIVKLVRGEYGYPVGFYLIDAFCKQAGVKSVGTEDALNAIKSAGFKVTKIHYYPRGFKTDADAAQLVEIFKQFR